MGFLYALTKKFVGPASPIWSHHFRPSSQGRSDQKQKMRDEFFVIRARGDDVLLRLLRMLREGCIDMKPLNRMDDDSLFRQVCIWFDPTSTTSVFTFEST